MLLAKVDSTNKIEFIEKKRKQKKIQVNKINKVMEEKNIKVIS